jgi:hypothetical protein
MAQVLGRERSCGSFTKWLQGFTPKEHAEMIQQEELARIQTKRDEDERAWKTAEADKAHHRAMLALWIAILGPIIGAFATAAVKFATDKETPAPVVNVSPPAIPAPVVNVAPAPAPVVNVTIPARDLPEIPTGQAK